MFGMSRLLVNFKFAINDLLKLGKLRYVFWMHAGTWSIKIPKGLRNREVKWPLTDNFIAATILLKGKFTKNRITVKCKIKLTKWIVSS